jgi:hypothetical protein
MRWRHKKRGTTYEVLSDTASLQCASAPAFEEQFEDDLWTVYRSEATQAIYIRPTEEFLDGRFEKIEE